jgi:HSP20 family protein
LRDEVNQLVSNLFGRPAVPWSFRLDGGSGFPPINQWEGEDNLLLEAELPGVKSENLGIAVVGNELTIAGKRSELADGDATYHCRERGTGDFNRIVHLPAEVDADNVKAELNNGVLWLHLPKAESAKPRKIKVEAK